MNILLANLMLKKFGGTESWTYTMTHELAKQGHKVEIFSLDIGVFGYKYLSKFHLHDVAPTKEYDLLLINQNRCLKSLANVKGYKIVTSHSYFLDVERFTDGADKYVSVSEEIKDIESKRGFESEVIGNPIDCDRFSPINSIHDKLTRVLYLTKDDNGAYPIIKEACQEMGIEIITPEKPVFEVETYINKVDCVIGIGRCLLEAMACGRNVISADHRFWMKGFEGAGMITPDNYEKAKYAMFSGRNMPIAMTKEEVKRQLTLYNPEYGRFLRERILEDYESKKIVYKYLHGR